MLISSSIPNLLNGVSQQPPSVRSRSQAEVQENGLSSPARGLEKRPPTRHIAALTGAAHGGNAFIHTIKYSTEELYVMLINSSGIRIYDREGVERSITGVSGLPTYLSTVTDFTKDIAATTASDTTILVNKKRTAAMSSTRSPARNKEALVYVKQGDFNLTYRIALNWGTGSYTASFNTPDGDVASEGTQANSTHILSQLVSLLNNTANVPAAAGFTFTNFGSTLHISRSSGDFSVSVEDGRGGQFILAAKGTVRRFLDLPNQAPNGFIIKVNGNTEEDRDDYYVKYNAPDGTTSAGVWVETIAPDSLTALDATTMPHRLVKLPNGTFEYSPVPWVEKNAGDDDAIPLPSFIGSNINDVFFYRNRMGFLSGENIVFSESGKFFNVFPTTAIQLLDSDPIDVAVSNVRPSILQHAVPFNESLLLFSNLTQFVLTAEQLLTPATVSIEVATNFEADLTAKPAPAGRYVYFATKLGAWAGFREYYVDAANETKDANDITGHVPNYIAGGASKLSASSNEDMMLVLTDAEPNNMYVYKWYWKGAEKLVSSWSKWTFKGRVRAAEFNGSEIFMIMEYGTSLFLERLVLSADDAATELTYTDNYIGGGALLLDRRVRLTGPMPYSDVDTVYVNKFGRTIPQPDVAAQIAADGFVYAGIPYEFRYTFSQQFVMAQETAVTTGWLTLKDFKLVYANTAFFQVDVELRARGTSTLEFTGKILGSSNNTIGDANLESGTFRIPVNTKAEYAKVTIKSSSHLPCKFQSAEWAGLYILQSTRM